jgi:hypothetical protein
LLTPLDVDGVTLNAGRRRLPEEIDGNVSAGNASVGNGVNEGVSADGDVSWGSEIPLSEIGSVLNAGALVGAFVGALTPGTVTLGNVDVGAPSVGRPRLAIGIVGRPSVGTASAGVPMPWRGMNGRPTGGTALDGAPGNPVVGALSAGRLRHAIGIIGRPSSGTASEGTPMPCSGMKGSPAERPVGRPPAPRIESPASGIDDRLGVERLRPRTGESGNETRAPPAIDGVAALTPFVARTVVVGTATLAAAETALLAAETTAPTSGRAIESLVRLTAPVSDSARPTSFDPDPTVIDLLERIVPAKDVAAARSAASPTCHTTLLA